MNIKKIKTTSYSIDSLTEEVKQAIEKGTVVVSKMMGVDFIQKSYRKGKICVATFSKNVEKLLPKFLTITDSEGKPQKWGLVLVSSDIPNIDTEIVSLTGTFDDKE